MPSEVSVKFRTELLRPYVTATCKCILMQPGFVYNAVAHQSYTDVSAQELAGGNGYIVGGQTLTGAALLQDDVRRQGVLSWANVSWTATGGPIGPVSGAIIYADSLPDKMVLQYIQFDRLFTTPESLPFTILDPVVRTGA